MKKIRQTPIPKFPDMKSPLHENLSTVNKPKHENRGKISPMINVPIQADLSPSIVSSVLKIFVE